MKFCTTCQKTYPDDAQFCQTCRQALSDMQPAPAPAEPPAKQYQMSSGGIVLHSAAPIPLKTGWCKWGYIVCLALGAITGGAGLVLLIFMLAIDGMINQWHREKIRRMKFKFVSQVSADEIYNRLQPVLARKYGNSMSFEREGDKLSVDYDSVFYDIVLNEDGTVTIWWRKSLAGAIFRFREGKLYRKIRTGTPLLAYELQQLFGVHE